MKASTIQALGQLTDTTFGYSSTAGNASESIKVTLQGDSVIVKFSTIVHLVNDRPQFDQTKIYENEATQKIKKYMEKLTGDFKKATGYKLKTKQISFDTSLELMTMSAYSPRKIACYRATTVFKVDE
jgi:hypothetical protein